MQKSPYNFSEAEKICADYQYLIGKPFDKTNSDTIDCIAIAPFDIDSKSRFIVYYLLFEDAAQALRSEYKGLLFDVLVMGGSVERNELRHMDIYTWLLNNGLSADNAPEAMLHHHFSR